MNPQTPDFISPDISKSQNAFIDQVPLVPNSGDLFERTIASFSDTNLSEKSKEYWVQVEPRYVTLYDQGVGAGKHCGYDSQIGTNPVKISSKLLIDLITLTFRKNDKSLHSVKFILDILKSLQDNIEHIIKTDNIKINSREVIAYIHGFANGLLTKNNKEQKSNE